MTLTPLSFPRTTLDVYQTSLVALHCGISCIPIVVNGTKSPAVRWKDYQQKMPTLDDATRWFYGKHRGIAFITGAVSGGLEMLDFDSGAAYEEFVARMQQEGLAGLLEKIEQGCKERSPKGLHLYYRCAWIEGNKKVAQRPLLVPPWVESKIETRGEGGYSIGAPSPGSVHTSGLPYQLIQGSLATIQTITAQERAVLLAVARACDEMPPPQEVYPFKERSHSPRNMQRKDGKRLPGHIFNERGPSWAEVLEPHGWTHLRSIGNEDFWRRPGKEKGLSATTNYEGSDYLYVFSTSTIFPTRVGISKFAAYTFLEHNGDFSAATKALVAQGYVEERFSEKQTK